MKPLGEDEEEWTKFNPLSGRSRHIEILQKLAAATESFFPDEFDEEASGTTEGVSVLPKIESRAKKPPIDENKQSQKKKAKDKSTVKPFSAPRQPPSSPKKDADEEKPSHVHLLCPLPAVNSSLALLIDENVAISVSVSSTGSMLTQNIDGKNGWAVDIPQAYGVTHLRLVSWDTEAMSEKASSPAHTISDTIHLILLVMISTPVTSSSSSYLSLYFPTSGYPLVCCVQVPGGPVSVVTETMASIAMLTIDRWCHIFDLKKPSKTYQAQSCLVPLSLPDVAEIYLLPAQDARLVLTSETGTTLGFKDGVWQRLDGLEFMNSDFYILRSVEHKGPLSKLQSRARSLRWAYRAKSNSVSNGNELATLLMSLLGSSQSEQLGCSPNDNTNGCNNNNSINDNNSISNSNNNSINTNYNNLNHSSNNSDLNMNGLLLESRNYSMEQKVSRKRDSTLEHLTQQVASAAFLLSGVEFVNWLRALCARCVDLQFVDVLSCIALSAVHAAWLNQSASLNQKLPPNFSLKVRAESEFKRATWGQYSGNTDDTCGLTAELTFEQTAPHNNYLPWAFDVEEMGVDSEDLLVNVVGRQLFSDRCEELRLSDRKVNTRVVPSEELTEGMTILLGEVLMKVNQLKRDLNHLDNFVTRLIRQSDVMVISEGLRNEGKTRNPHSDTTVLYDDAFDAIF